MFEWRRNPWWVAFETPVVFLVVMAVAAVIIALSPKLSESRPTPPVPPVATATPPSTSVPSVAIPAPVPSASNTEKDAKLDAALKRVDELESKLKAGPGIKPEPEAKTQSLGEWFASWSSFKLASPPSVAPAPTTPSVPKAPPAPTGHPQTLLDKQIAEIQEMIRKGKAAESTSAPATSSVPTIAPPPKAAPEPTPKSGTSLFSFSIPSLPSPPSIRSVSIKGPAGGSSFFSGGCSAREVEVDLANIKDNDGWLTLTEGGKNECYITNFYHEGAIIQARDGMGEFLLKPGVTRNPRAVRLVAGRGYFKYSACTRTPEARGHALDWDCSIR